MYAQVNIYATDDICVQLGNFFRQRDAYRPAVRYAMYAQVNIPAIWYAIDDTLYNVVFFRERGGRLPTS